MADIASNRGKVLFLNGGLDWDTTPGVRCLLLATAVGTPDPDLNFVSQLVDGVNNIELATTNYARIDLTGRTVTQDDANNRAVLDAADAIFANLGPSSGGPTVRAIVTYLRVGGDDSTPADDPWIYFHDLVDTQVNSGNFTTQWAAAGLSTHT